MIAIALVALALPFALLTADHPLDHADRAPLSVRQLVGSYWLSPRTYPDFGWAWLTRFLASLAIALGTLYLLYFLRDAVHYPRLFPGQTAQDGLLILIVIYTGCVVVTAIVGRMISDRLGRRKLIVTISGALIASAALLLTFAETWTAAMVAAVLFGGGFRRVPGCRSGADHPGAACGPGPGQGSRDHQHRHRRAGRPRRRARGAAGLGGRLPDPVRGDRRRRRLRLDLRLADQERPLT